MTTINRMTPLDLVLLKACTDDAVTTYPHLSVLRDRALAGGVQALTALIHQCDALALAMWWPHDRQYVVAIRNRAEDDLVTPESIARAKEWRDAERRRIEALAGVTIRDDGHVSLLQARGNPEKSMPR